MWCIPRAQHRNRMSVVVPPTTTARVPLHDAQRTLLHAPRHNGSASDANQAAIRHSMPCVHAQAHSGTARNDALSGRLLSWEARACACAERTFGRAITACEQRIEQWISMLVPCQPPGTAKNSFTKSLRPAGTTRRANSLESVVSDSVLQSHRYTCGSTCGEHCTIRAPAKPAYGHAGAN